MNGRLDVTSATENGGPIFQIGDKVKKVSGYRWPGEVVSVFRTCSGQWRVVVECQNPEVEGALHIYNLGQIEFDETDEKAERMHAETANLFRQADLVEQAADDRDLGSEEREVMMQAAGKLRRAARVETVLAGGTEVPTNRIG